MNSKYVDTTAIVQLIGCTFRDPSILDNTDMYHITEDDFVEEFHKIVFGSINNIHLTDSSKIDIQTIVDYLTVRPKAKAIFDKNKGEEYLAKIAEAAKPETFNYYYQRVKKMSLLRAYSNIVGMDVSFLYDPSEIIDTKKRQEQEEWLDSTSIGDIAQIIDRKIDEIKNQYVDDNASQDYQASDGMEELIKGFEKTPEVGIPMYGRLINTVTRGARLGKFYLRSGATGTGKTRSMVADACYFACNRIYEEPFGWIKCGTSEPTVYIATEQDKSEIQTMMIAFISGVNEDHILNGKYDEGERDRVFEAIKIFKAAPLWIVELPEFSLLDVENVIKKHIRENSVKYVCHDYIHTSIKILEEITRRSGGVKLREDNILFMLSTRLKDICIKYGIFILSGTQLNADYQESETPDQNLLRGAKSIADKIDLGMILLGVTDKDLASLDKILKTGQFDIPNIKLSIYKNRRGAYKGVYLWCKADLGTCRIQPMFCTNFRYELIGIEDAKIIVEEESAF